MRTALQSRGVSPCLLLVLVVLGGCRTTAGLQPACPEASAHRQALTHRAFRPGAAPSVVEALRGRVAGLTVRSVGGRTFLQVRGASSFQDVEPLVVVDGIRMASRGVMGLAALNVRDVASVEVLKNVADLAMYGSEGSAGVIVVHTRRGGCGQ